MAWPGAMPSFSSGQVLSAADMNKLSDGIEYLYGLLGSGGGGGGGFSKVTIPTSGLDADWEIVHQARYFHYKIEIDGGDMDLIQIKYNGTAIFSDATSQVGPYTWAGYVDLNASPGGLTDGARYEIHVDFDWQSGSESTGTVHYLLESDSTTL